MARSSRQRTAAVKTHSVQRKRPSAKRKRKSRKKNSRRGPGKVKSISAQEAHERLKSDFVSTVSHELRTPLTALREGLALVLDGSVGQVDPEASKFLALAKHNADRLKALIDDLLDISRLEAGKLHLQRTPCDMPSLLADLPNSFQFTIRKKEIVFKTEFEQDLPYALADRSRILQVLVNLVGNAVKFVGIQGHVTVRMSSMGGRSEKIHQILVEVIDDGPGMPEEELPRVFEKFHQVGRTHGPGTKGTGLGLTICRHIVELHKGNIWVSSKAGKGTIFMFTLPAYSEDLECREVFNEFLDRAADTHKPLGVMVIELENFAALAASRSLREAQHTIETIRRLLLNVLSPKDKILHFRELQLICLLEHAGEAELRIASRATVSRLKAKAFPWDVRIGLGRATYPQQGRTWAGLLRACEQTSKTVIGTNVPTKRMGKSRKPSLNNR